MILIPFKRSLLDVMMVLKQLKDFRGIVAVLISLLKVWCFVYVVILTGAVNLKPTDDPFGAFSTSDASDSIPTICCEANSLFRIPPISLDPVAEQVHSNSQALRALCSIIEGLEKKLSDFLVSGTTIHSYMCKFPVMEQVYTYIV